MGKKKTDKARRAKSKKKEHRILSRLLNKIDSETMQAIIKFIILLLTVLLLSHNVKSY